MALQADKDGFLTGAATKIDTGSVGKLISIMSVVRGDVAAIRKALTGQSPSRAATPIRGSGNGNSQAYTRRITPSGRVAASVQRDGGSRASVARNASGSSPNAAGAGSPAALQRQQAAVVSASSRLADTIARERGKDGRFKKKGGASGGDSDTELAGQSGKAGFWARLKNAFSDSVSGADIGETASQLDPAAAAAGEVASAVAPIAKVGGGLFRFFRGDQDAKAAEKAAKKNHVPWYKKLLKAVEEDREGGGGAPATDGDGNPIPVGGLAGIIARMAGMVLPALAIAGAAMLGTSIGTWIYDRFAPQIATAVDNTVQFAKDSWATVTKKWDEIAGGWTALTDDIGTKWTEITDAIGEKFGIVKEAAVDAYETVVDNTSRGIESGVNLYNDLRDKASRGMEAVANAAGSARDTVIDKTSRGIEYGASAAGSVKDWVLGKTSKQFESGKGGAGTVSTGKGDHGGASYGTYQLSSKQGTLQKFLKSTKYGEQFAGLTPGSKEFNDKWKDVAKNDETFGAAQHDYIKDTHYNPQMNKLAKGGIDLSKRGAAVQDAVWSTSVQFGGETSLIQKALAGKNVDSMKDEDITAAIQDYKIANNDKLFASSSAAVKAGTLNRAINEKKNLAALANAPTVTAATEPVPPATTAAIPESLQKVPPMPPTPIASNTGKGNDSGKVAVLGDNIFSQNLSDRSVAQVVTGGIGFQGGKA